MNQYDPTVDLKVNVGISWSNGFMLHLEYTLMYDCHSLGLTWLFLIYHSPRCFLPSFKSIGLSVQEKKQKIDFQAGRHGGYLGFPIGTIIAIFDL